jgi:histidinol-phosphate phosphatase family protein
MSERLISNWKINSDWTLFLDRDGVINKEKNKSYIKNIEEFKFIDGVLESLKTLSKIFPRIIIVSNQQGVGKGIMTMDKLNEISNHMIEKIKSFGGRIDACYYAPDLKISKSNLRKPGTGMADLAKIDFKEIDFNKSVIIGNSSTDIKFGERLGMKTVYIGKSINISYDVLSKNLFSFTELLISNM